MAGRPKRAELEQRWAEAAALAEVQGVISEREINYLAKVFAQIGLPYKNPGDHLLAWTKANGNVSLMLQPGVKPGPDGVAVSRGYPYGTIPRLLLAWISTEVVRHKNQEWENPDDQYTLILGRGLMGFMNTLGITPSGGQRGSIGRLREQMERLFNCKFIVNQTTTGSAVVHNIPVASSYQLFWSDAEQPVDRQPGERRQLVREQQSLFPSTVTLTPRFYNEIADSAVPLDVAALRRLRHSPVQLDLYSWLTYRMFTLRHPVTISWEAVQSQFGADYADTPQGRSRFKQKFRDHLAEVKKAYPAANVEVVKTGMVLRPSPTSIPTKALKALTAS